MEKDNKETPDKDRDITIINNDIEPSITEIVEKKLQEIKDDINDDVINKPKVVMVGHSHTKGLKYIGHSIPMLSMDLDSYNNRNEEKMDKEKNIIDIIDEEKSYKIHSRETYDKDFGFLGGIEKSGKRGGESKSETKYFEKKIQKRRKRNKNKKTHRK